jgi:hypothetical protein
MSVKLDVFLTDRPRSIAVSFATEAQALAYLDRPSVATAVEREDSLIPNDWKLLIDKLYPTCPHGLSLDLCEGTQHYPYDDEEKAFYAF